MSQRTEAWRKRVVDGVPLPFLTHAHELATTAITVVLGLPAMLGILPGQGTAADPLPFPLWEVWGGSLVTAAVFTVWGIFRARPRLEWAGQVLAGWGLAFWAAILAVVFGPATYVSISVFLVLAAVSFWRAFKITSQPFIQYRLTRAAREAHVQVRKEQPGRRRT